MKFVIVTGLSGAGKSLALKRLEDLGYFCVDNLPPSLIPQFAEICLQGGRDKAAAAVDMRMGEMFIGTFLKRLKPCRQMIRFRWIFFFWTRPTKHWSERFKETRRKHPLLNHGVCDGRHH